MTAYHQPVMADEVLSYLEPRGGALLLDGTLGGGGHTRALLQACPGCRVIAVDREIMASQGRFYDVPEEGREARLRPIHSERGSPSRGFSSW